jgi:hypothetical protein
MLAPIELRQRGTTGFRDQEDYYREDEHESRLIYVITLTDILAWLAMPADTWT